MQTITRIAEMRALVREWRFARESIAFVPTMGNLHAGHASLIGAAHLHGRRVVASVFVNPLQFGPYEDFAAYPRTPDDDASLLAAQGVDVLFLPTVEEMYPLGVAGSTIVDVPELSGILCGAFRPGHFQGVATVVVKLLNLVQPDVGIFGEKDYQQLTIIRRSIDYVKAMWHYARGVAQAMRGDPAAARGEVEAMRRLAQSGDYSGLVAGGVPAPDVIALAQHVVLGRIAQSAGGLGASARRVRAGGGAGGQARLLGTALLLLPGAPVAGGCVAGRRQAGRSRSDVPAEPAARAQ